MRRGARWNSSRAGSRRRCRSMASRSPRRCGRGSCSSPAHGRTVGELLQRAEIASQEAKDRRVALMIYDPARDLRSRERLLFAAQLREGIDRDELRRVLQPKIDLETAQVVGARRSCGGATRRRACCCPTASSRFASARARWERSRSGCSRRRCGRCSVALARFGLHVAVNLSPQNLADVNLPARLAELLSGTAWSVRRSGWR